MNPQNDSPWEVNPLWVSKLIPHKVEVRVSAQCHRDEPNHFVKGNPSVHYTAGRISCHVEVHILVHQPEGDGFGAHQRLHSAV